MRGFWWKHPFMTSWQSSVYLCSSSHVQVLKSRCFRKVWKTKSAFCLKLPLFFPVWGCIINDPALASLMVKYFPEDFGFDEFYQTLCFHAWWWIAAIYYLQKRRRVYVSTDKNTSLFSHYFDNTPRGLKKLHPEFSRAITFCRIFI